MEIRNEVENVIEDVQIHDHQTKSAITTIPFIKNNNFDYAWLVSWAGDYQTAATCILFIIVVTFLVTAVSNGSNLTDGLDGLAAGSSTIMGVALGILAYTSSHLRFASFLNIMFIPGAEELVIFAAAFIGATVGFLWWNAYPAQVFMGDTGCLTLGGIIAVFAILIRKELLLPLLCGIFLAESISVILQVAYFKQTKKKYGEGRRIFKMTPLHHHFQKKGNDGIQALIQKPLNAVPESKIVVRFWLIGIILAALAIITLKVR
jgi:phospho-N-acetylmuramoyl-pentapeptide-transferase